jgi:pilus assembly protein CpaF
MASAVLTNASIGATRYVGSPLDLPRRAHALLAERFPAHRTKHKPLSILRQEGRRALEQFFDAQVPPPAKADRDRQVEEILGEANGFGPLEELFRDEAVREVMVLAAAQVIVRKDGGWVPTSVRFRDPAHQRTYLRRLADTGEPFVTGGGGGDGAFDVRLANGFRVIGVLPPDVLDTPPVAVFVRGLPHTADQPAPTFPTATMSGLPAQGSGVTTMPLHRLPLPPKPGSVGVTAAEITRIAPASGTFNKPDSLPPRPTPLPVPDAPVSEFYLPPGMDPKERMRRRVSERIIRKCAAAGVYDLSAIPAAELQRVILAHVEELNGEDTRRLNDQEMQMVALEIFTGMRR